MTQENFPLIRWADSMPQSYVLISRGVELYDKIVIDVYVIYTGSVVWRQQKIMPLDTALADVMKCVEFFQKESNEYIRLKASEL